MRLPVILLASSAFLLGGCNMLFGPQPGPPSPGPMAAANLTLTTATKAPFGTYVTDGSGRAVYVLEGTRGLSGINRCSGPCLAEWPPVPAPQLPTAGAGLSPPAVRTVSSYRGTQVSYSGWPLYYFSHDMAPGDTTGQGVRDQWGSWSLIRPSGEPIAPHY